MGFFGRLKRVARGAVRIEVSVPPSFSWSSEILPVAITLTNEDDDPRTIRKIEVELEKAGSANVRWPAGCEIEMSEEISLAPGQTVHLQMPLPVGAVGSGKAPDMVELARANGLPDWVGRLKVKGHDTGVRRESSLGRHEIEVELNLTNGRVVEKKTYVEAV